MKTISWRTFRHETSTILRDAEAGEPIVITVQGRPVALLGPYEPRRWVSAADVRQTLSTPTDPTVLDDLRRFG